MIRSLNVDKVHGHDNKSIRMLKICDTAIIKPLSITFNNSITENMFPDIWKKLNIPLFIKNMINKLLIITGHYHRYQFVE